MRPHDYQFKRGNIDTHGQRPGNFTGQDSSIVILSPPVVDEGARFFADTQNDKN